MEWLAKVTAGVLGHPATLAVIEYAKNSKPKLWRAIRDEFPRGTTICYEFWVPEGPARCAITCWLENGAPRFGFATSEIPLEAFSREYAEKVRRWLAELPKAYPEARFELHKTRLEQIERRPRVVVINGS